MYGHDEQLGSHPGWEVTASVDTAEPVVSFLSLSWGGIVKKNSCQPAEEERKECGEVWSGDWRRAELYLVRLK